MSAMVGDIRSLLVRELESFIKEIELFPDDKSVWGTLPGVVNSAGNLALHVCGNLRHFIGAVLGNDGYVRHREAEFSTRSLSRQEVVREIRQTIAVVSDVVPGLSERTLSDTYPEKVGGVSLPCGRFLIHLCAHAAFHLGQAGYLRRCLLEQNESSGAVSLTAIEPRGKR
jgi:uncharacterized damage-inducible protein DinB